jgi:hypothetical protein
MGMKIARVEASTPSRALSRLPHLWHPETASVNQRRDAARAA